MTREEFVRQFAGGDAPWAALGLVDMGGKTRVALPCGCGDPSCKGWAMVSADSIIDHLALQAPEPLRSAYHEAVRNAEASS